MTSLTIAIGRSRLIPASNGFFDSTGLASPVEHIIYFAAILEVNTGGFASQSGKKGTKKISHATLCSAMMVRSRLLSSNLPIRGNRSKSIWRRAFLVASTISSRNKDAGFASAAFCEQARPLPGAWSNTLEKRSGFSSTSNFLPTSSSRRYFTKESTSENSDDPQKQKEDLNPRAFILSQNPEPEDQKILEKTLDWVQNVVIGMSMCPFAEKPFRSKEMYLEVIHGQVEEEILGRVLGQCLIRQKKAGTSLMICPDLYPKNFETFLQVYNMLNEGVLEDHDLTDDIQIAPFHPLFEFDGSGSDGVDNYTNRSPYPIFHVLREEEVEKAVDLLDGDASKVWRRNVDLLEMLGEEFTDEELKQIMTGAKVDLANRDKVKQIQRKLKQKTNNDNNIQ